MGVGAVTVMSSKGQVVLPAAVRRSTRWGPGTRLLVEETADGVMLRRAPLFEPTEADAVFGMLAGDESLSLEEIDAALAAEGARRAGR